MSAIIGPCTSNGDAWLRAVDYVDARDGHQSRNIVIEVDDPIVESETDKAVRDLLDKFLVASGLKNTRSTANLIFPQSIYARHGNPEFYARYEKAFPRLKRGSWGTYFNRMMTGSTVGHGENRLRNLVGKIAREAAADATHGNALELPITGVDADISTYDAGRDENRLIGGPCLSHLSFKLVNKTTLDLTAVYRNHYYIQRLYGNLLGLGWLMKFVADETGVNLGGLTVISTHAIIDTPANAGRAEVDTLLADCGALAE